MAIIVAASFREAGILNKHTSIYIVHLMGVCSSPASRWAVSVLPCSLSHVLFRWRMYLLLSMHSFRPDTSTTHRGGQWARSRYSSGDLLRRPGPGHSFPLCIPAAGFSTSGAALSLHLSWIINVQKATYYVFGYVHTLKKKKQQKTDFKLWENGIACIITGDLSQHLIQCLKHNRSNRNLTNEFINYH